MTGPPFDNEIAFREFLKGPTPIHYCLGRPLAPVFALNPAEIAIQVERLTALCLSRIPSGAMIRVAGDWLSEASLYTVLSLALTKLRKLGYSEHVCGSPRESNSVPPRPNSIVVALLGSGDYNSLDEWSESQLGRVVILAEHVEHATGVPDIVIPTPRRSATEAFAKPFLASLQRTWKESAGTPIQAGLLRCASGLDIPPDYLGKGPLPAPFVPARMPDDQPTGWSNIEGSWLARHALRDMLHYLHT